MSAPTSSGVAPPRKSSWPAKMTTTSTGSPASRIAASVDPKPTRSCGDSADTNVPTSNSAAALRRSRKWSHMRRAVQCRWLTMSTTAADPSVCSMPSWTV